MTHDDDIPELLNRLEGRLDSPSADAIRTEASRRRALRRRMVSTAGVGALIMAITGSALWFTRDTATTTATVAEDAVELVDVQPVAADSAPIEESTPIAASAATIGNIPQALRSLGRLEIVPPFDRAPWEPKAGAFVDFSLSGRSSTGGEDKNGVIFSDGCEIVAFWIEWDGRIFALGDPVDLPDRDDAQTDQCLGSNEQQLVGEPFWSGAGSILASYNPANNTFRLSSLQPPRGTRVVSPLMDTSWTMSLAGPEAQTLPSPSSTPPTTGPAPLNAQGVVRMDDNCMNFTHLQLRDHGWFIVSDPPLEWQGRPTFDVAVELDASGGFVATDRDGLSATFAFDVDEAQSRSCRRWVNPTPQEALPTIDARSVDDCITGFNATAQVSTIINGPDENETAWAIFQEAEDWEGNANVCWISISTDMSCRSYAWFKEQGRDPTGFAEDPPLDPDQPCVGDGTQFDGDSAR